jgi:outer membrane protein, heavy metal efflux system
MLHPNSYWSKLRSSSSAWVLAFALYTRFVAAPLGEAATENTGSVALPVDFKLKDERPKDLVTPERTLSLQASFEKAYENNKEIIAAEYNLPIAKAGIRIAGAIPNPGFGLQYGFGPQFKTILAGEPQQFGWQQDIQTAGKRTKQLNVARANYSLTELQVRALMFDVRNRVRRAYAEQAAAEAYAELIESERRVAFDLVHIAEARFGAGKTARSEVLQAQLGVMQFDTQRNQAQARLQQASAALSLIIGGNAQACRSN